ncbi:M36 family metallopeptidase [Stagnimonas aquatica]|uniref:M36 family metallopeptidase n=1 Tax=Stagnimonas aquatica TaxID=2689987 RepID=UPI0011CE90CE|nr:M36 family metallopeptidase [Stagnimonas aquatica]
MRFAPLRSHSRALFLLLGLNGLLSAPAQAVVQLYDEAAVAQRADVDYREGRLTPAVEADGLVRQLGARATWNAFGTVASLVKPGGYLATGLSQDAETAARQWLRQNRVLFKLSTLGVDELELINDGRTPGNRAQALLFRQRFSGLPAAVGGLITVGVIDGKVYYVSSSSAGEQPPASSAVLSPLQAWLRAAQDVRRAVPIANVLSTLDQSASTGWTLFKVRGFSQPQRARLLALPVPAGGVRQVFETVVLDVQAGVPLAYVHYVDAETGKVWRRENRVYNATAFPLVPQAYNGSFADAKTCAERHEYSVAAGSAAINLITTALLPTNSVAVNLYRANADGAAQLVASIHSLTGPAQVLNYAPSGGVPAGNYQVEVCPEDSFLSLGSLPPLPDYLGTFLVSPVDVSVTSVLLGADANAPQWKWFPSNPDQSYAGEDVRKVACFAPLPAGGLAGCDVDVTTTASRGPWDMLLGLVPTFTTIGNNAITAGGSLSPLTPSVPNPPLTLNRKYDFTFNNAWYKSGCSPLEVLKSQVPLSNGNDLSAVTTNLFVMHNRMHDFAYFLGFTEKNYNLQLFNFGLTPLSQQNDPELGTSQAGSITGSPWMPTYGTLPGRNNANQIALMDGVPGITNQYLFQPVGGLIYPPCTDGALDMGIAGHEYTHAISNRMVAGPDGNLTSEQGGAMGESWSDLVATEFQHAFGYTQAGGYSPTALGAYTTGNPVRGIRDYPLDDNPLNYGNYGFDTPGPEVHADGEIWNGLQWELRQAFIDQYNADYPDSDANLQRDCANGLVDAQHCPGNRRWIQLIFDAWLLMQSDVSMLDARDAMLAADLARFGGANQALMWRVFAKRGMGEYAYTDGGDDVEPVPSFESPLATDQAEIAFKVFAGDEGGAPISNARILVGRYATRTRQIADTDPATVVDETDEASRRKTLINRDSARFVPGHYEFMVVAPGYGIHHFEQDLKPGKATLSFTLPSNRASLSKGASVSTSASLAENIALKDQLIDDSEDTGAILGDAGLAVGAYATIALAGGEQTVSSVSVSTAAGPSNAGRWTALRSFEIRSCDGACADPVADFKNLVYTSADDAFPGVRPRPLQPDLNLRRFSFAPVKATHLQLRVLNTQCSGGPDFQGDQDSDPLNNTDCMSTSSTLLSALNILSGGSPITSVKPGDAARATEIQAYSSEAKAELSASSDPGGSSSGGGDGGSGRFGGGAAGLGLLLPLLLAAARRRRLASGRDGAELGAGGGR